jgi:hypothetical protein
VARMGEKRNICKLLVGKPEGKRPLGRQRSMWINLELMSSVKCPGGHGAAKVRASRAHRQPAYIGTHYGKARSKPASVHSDSMATLLRRRHSDNKATLQKRRQ